MKLALPINYEAAASFALVNLMIGLEIANQAERPQWHKGDFFRANICSISTVA